MLQVKAPSIPCPPALIEGSSTWATLYPAGRRHPGAGQNREKGAIFLRFFDSMPSKKRIKNTPPHLDPTPYTPGSPGYTLRGHPGLPGVQGGAGPLRACTGCWSRCGGREVGETILSALKPLRGGVIDHAVMQCCLHKRAQIRPRGVENGEHCHFQCLAA